MFAKTKCLHVLSRTTGYGQSRSFRKSNQLKYSAASLEGLSSKLKVKRNQQSVLESEQDEVESFTNKVTQSSYSELHSKPKHVFSDVILASKKSKLENLIGQAEELLTCRFHRPRSSPIGVGLSAADNQHSEYFRLLPSWFQAESFSMTSHIPLLLGSGHPILRLKQNIDPDAEEHSVTLLSNNFQWRAFVILLVTKAFGHPNTMLRENRKSLETAEAKQKTLSEIAEMMHTAFSLHRAIVEIRHSSTNDSPMEGEESSMHLGNKISVLLGDILLARTSKGLSALKNAKVTELMSDAIGDFSESEILRRRHLDYFKPVFSGSADVFKEFAERNDTRSESRLLPTFDSWKNRVALDIGSLIGRSCLCSTIFSLHDEGANKLAFDIGQQIGLVLQAYGDLEFYKREGGNYLVGSTLDLCSLPVVFHLNSDSVTNNHKSLDISEIYRDVMTSPVALLKTQNALEHLKEEALRLISKLPRSTPAPRILEDFIAALSY